MTPKDTQKQNHKRPPIIAVLGHVDHGKSTLLDRIRETDTTTGEVGGITQRLSAYEISHKVKETGEERFITFLDTPGHEAFTSIRERGAFAADIVILVVSAEDGVMPQTKEVINNLLSSKTPFVVAINKIDAPKANVQKTVQSLAENEVYLESMHGDVPSVSISAKTGEGIPELLDMILLVADIEELTGDLEKSAEGYVIESSMDAKVGNAAILIIKDGTLRVGDIVVAESSYSPVRQIYTHDGKTTKERSFSSPVSIAGWNNPPKAGTLFHTVKTKKDAEREIKNVAPTSGTDGCSPSDRSDTESRNIPIVLKADNVGSIEAIQQEIKKITNKNPDVTFSFLIAEAGSISEKDVQTAGIDQNALLIGFNTTIYGPAKRVSENLKIEPHFFSIIYELTEWLEDHVEKTRVLKDTDKIHGCLKVLKCFSRSKKGHVLGGEVRSGIVSKNDRVKIVRKDETVGQGRIKDLQKQKVVAKSVSEGQECGILLDSPAEVMEGDILSAFTVVKE